MFLAIFLGGCGADAPKPAQQAETKPAEPAVPEDIQSAAQAVLGSESQVLAFGDLAKNGKQQFLAANVVPKTPTNNIPGTIVTRVVIAENNDGKWSEILRCDEHLKNPKGFLGVTPLAPMTGWRLQYEQSEDKGLAALFHAAERRHRFHVLPIGVRWNQRPNGINRSTAPMSISCWRSAVVARREVQCCDERVSSAQPSRRKRPAIPLRRI